MKTIPPYILLVVQMPEPDPGYDYSLVWKDFSANALSGLPKWPAANNAQRNEQAQKPAENVQNERLAENIWLLSAKGNLPFLLKLVEQANHHKLASKCLAFGRYPQWEALEL
jgi:hypothetical protein